MSRVLFRFARRRPAVLVIASRRLGVAVFQADPASSAQAGTGLRNAIEEPGIVLQPETTARCQRGMLEDGANLIDGDAGKPLDKLCRRSAALEVLEQRGNRDPSPSEYPNAANPGRITLDCGAG